MCHQFAIKKAVQVSSWMLDTVEVVFMVYSVSIGRKILNLQTRVRFPVALPNLPLGVDPPNLNNLINLKSP